MYFSWQRKINNYWPKRYTGPVPFVSVNWTEASDLRLNTQLGVDPFLSMHNTPSVSSSISLARLPLSSKVGIMFCLYFTDITYNNTGTSYKAPKQNTDVHSCERHQRSVFFHYVNQVFVFAILCEQTNTFEPDTVCRPYCSPRCFYAPPPPINSPVVI